ncbi:PQQ-binding-like beta-propeller repeat protein [Actinoplanes bogorensis]|uniref:PQQ-binding-like beta-propeller repeat protein n=1 Tax=Paractinoplanes bogorensis TaxID=1610840 RepID=A0ABS5YFS7_9ACTN|nr:PQQ-binding-like beta-propeller repeat protein [Actinoplanes bogorensis]MBU2662176.1 PQQ-binding-like beta-propeller repeat protein [Actinoplanes bogorensis]
MPTDLDDIFASVARQADAIPLGTAAQARTRGRQRTRNGILATAAAVAVVLAGVGVAVGGGTERRADHKTVAPSPSVSTLVGPATMVGSPIPFGVKTQDQSPVIAGGRVFTAWRAGQNSVSVLAADLHSGAVDWKVTGLNGFDSELVGWGVRATEQGVMVSVDSTIHVMNPAGADTGDWVLTAGDLDEVVPFEKALVRRWDINGQVDAHDWRTGRKLWSVDPGATSGPDKVLRVVGDPAGGRVVLVTQTGKLQVRDAGTGTLVRTITPASPAQAGSNFIPYGEWLYEIGAGCCDGEAYRVVTSNLVTGASSVILQEGAGHSPAGLTACGPGRVCVLDQGDNALTTVTAVDVAQGKKIWSVPGPSMGTSISARGTQVLVSTGQMAVLFDERGEQALRILESQVSWLDDGRLLALPTLGSGEVATIAVPGYQATRHGRIPVDNDMCVASGDRLACNSPRDLQIYDISG